MKLAIRLLVGCVLACGLLSAQDAKKTAKQLTGDAKGSAANNPVCKLFTGAEVSKYVGKAVGEPKNAAMGSGCQWVAKDDEGDMLVQIVAASYHVPPTGASSYLAMPDLGTKGFVVSEMGSWKAAVVRGQESITVMVSGPTVNQQTAVAALKETLARRK